MSGQGSGEGPEYGWLYGGKGKPPEGADPDATRAIPRGPQQPSEPPPADATRMMPTQPRPGTPETPRTTRPTPPRPAPPVAPPLSRPPRRRPRFRIRYVFLLLLAWIVFLVAVPIVSWNTVDKVDFDPGGERPSGQPGTTYLLVGTDSREGLTKEERKELSTGNAGGSRTDTIMLLHTGSGPNLLMSLPRDSIVDIPGHGETKINAAYAYGGPKLLVQTIENETGIRVDQYVEIGMGGVAGIVDSVGGIEVCPKTQHGRQAGRPEDQEGLPGRRRHHGARLRPVAAHLGHSATSTGSAASGRSWPPSARRSLSPWTVLNPVRYWRLNHAIPDFFKFGEGMGPVRAGCGRPR